MIDEATQEKIEQWAKSDPLGFANWLEKELESAITRMEAEGTDTSKTQQTIEKIRSAMDTLKKVGLIKKLGENLGKIVGIDSV